MTWQEVLVKHKVAYPHRLSGKVLTVTEWDPKRANPDVDTLCAELGELGLSLKIKPKPPWRAIQCGTHWYFQCSRQDACGRQEPAVVAG